REAAGHEKGERPPAPPPHSHPRSFRSPSRPHGRTRPVAVSDTATRHHGWRFNGSCRVSRESGESRGSHGPCATISSHNNPDGRQGVRVGGTRSGGAQPLAEVGTPDRQLVKALYQEFGGPLLGHVMRLTGHDKQWAEDVVQETLFRAWRNAGKLTREPDLLWA